MRIDYRDAVPADAVALERLFRRSFTETFGHLYAAEDLAAFLARCDEAAWADELADPGLSIRLAEADGEAVGFAKVGSVSLPVSPKLPSMELRQFYILRPWQGVGIAQELMRWTLDQARERGGAGNLSQRLCRQSSRAALLRALRLRVRRALCVHGGQSRR